MIRPTLAARLWWAIRSHWHVLAGVLPGVVLALLSSASLVVPQAEIIDALDTDRYRIHWISGSFILGSALGMALTRFVASRLGLRRAYLLSIVLFAIAGSACGLVDDIVLMTPLRFLQGLGNGVLICAAMLIIWRAFPRQREFAMALYGMAIFVPMAAGAVLGGLLTTWQSWQLIFLMNLPLGCAVLVIGWALLPVENYLRHEKPVKLDFVGVGLLTASIVSLNVMLDMGQYWGWFTSRPFSLWFVGFVAAFGSFVAWGLLARHPLINLRVFGRRNTTLALVVKTLFSINLTALLALLATYMVGMRGYQWWQAALVFLPAVLCMPLTIVLGVLFGKVHNTRLRMFAGLAVMSLATWQFMLLDMYTSKFWMAAIMGVWGLGAGLVIGPALLMIFKDLPLEDAVTLAGVFNICRALPAYIVTITLVTLWTQNTDIQFDNLRQTVRYNVPIVEASYTSARQHFVARGSAHDESAKQAQALMGQWTQVNSRAFALEDVLRDLAIVTALALAAVVAMGRLGSMRQSKRAANATLTAG
ncbi:MAG TPA: MFS transporter [Pirellulales bacterium]